MIRINLLQDSAKQAKTRTVASSGGDSNGAAWGAFYLVAGLATLAAVAGIYFIYSGRLEDKLRRNREFEQRCVELEQRTERLEQVKAELDRSKKLEEVVAELNLGRTGPTRMLLEVTNILSEQGGPTVDPARLEEMRRENPLAGFNRGWDTRRLWITRFEEDDRQAKIWGFGKTNEDVAEFLRRLAISDLFDEVTLTKTEAQVDRETEITFIGFELTGKVTY